jgi:hypothetical protein
LNSLFCGFLGIEYVICLGFSQDVVLTPRAQRLPLFIWDELAPTGLTFSSDISPCTEAIPLMAEYTLDACELAAIAAQAGLLFVLHGDLGTTDGEELLFDPVAILISVSCYDHVDLTQMV